MFGKGVKVNTNLKLLQKRISHVNLQNLQNMQSKGLVIRLLNFTKRESIGIDEACQFGKKHRHPFSIERNVSKGVLDVVHSDVWEPTQTATFGRCR